MKNRKTSVTEPEEKSSGSSGSSMYRHLSSSLPETAYTADEIEIKPNSRYVSALVTVQRDGVPMELTDVIKGELTADGGKVQFYKPVIYPYRNC